MAADLAQHADCILRHGRVGEHVEQGLGREAPGAGCAPDRAEDQQHGGRGPDDRSPREKRQKRDGSAQMAPLNSSICTGWPAKTSATLDRQVPSQANIGTAAPTRVRSRQGAWGADSYRFS